MTAKRLEQHISSFHLFRILGVSKILGCSVATTEKTVKGQSKHYTVTLKVPLVFNVPTPRGGRKKRN